MNYSELDGRLPTKKDLLAPLMSPEGQRQANVLGNAFEAILSQERIHALHPQELFRLPSDAYPELPALDNPLDELIQQEWNRFNSDRQRYYQTETYRIYPRDNHQSVVRLEIGQELIPSMLEWTTTWIEVDGVQFPLNIQKRSGEFRFVEAKRSRKEDLTRLLIELTRSIKGEELDQEVAEARIDGQLTSIDNQDRLMLTLMRGRLSLLTDLFNPLNVDVVPTRRIATPREMDIWITHTNGSAGITRWAGRTETGDRREYSGLFRFGLQFPFLRHILRYPPTEEEKMDGISGREYIITEYPVYIYRGNGSLLGGVICEIFYDQSGRATVSFQNASKDIRELQMR